MAVTSESIFYRTPVAQARVVVTGLSAITPVGTTAQKSWNNLVEGKSGIDLITQFDTSDFTCKIAGEVQDFNPDNYLSKKDQRKMERFIQFALVASEDALKDANLEITEELEEKTGCLIGVGLGGLQIIETNANVVVDRGPSRISPFFIPMAIANMAAGQVAIKHKARGPNYSVTSACASGAHAIGEAVSYIRRGLCDRMIVGGAESVVTKLGIGGFSAMRALSTRNDDPQKASRPWDEGRDGFVLGEGCGMLVLESYESAKRRDARIYCEVTGYGATCDAFHMTNPHEEGRGASKAIELALEDASLKPEDIQYINAHGTSTKVGDELETQAIKNAFGDHAKELLISSTKSMTGHLLGAAGAVESVFSILALKNNTAPPTLNLENPSFNCDLNYTPLIAKKRNFKHVLNNSFGFGGTNACLIFSELEN